MITKIKLSNVASYDLDGIVLENLNKFNFIYGNNGCGKSTLSKVLKAPEEYGDCIIEDEGEPFKTLVYNKDFINSNFNQSHEIPGIFTLGNEAITIQDEIKEKKDQLNHLNSQLPKREEQIEQERTMLSKLDSDFMERAWELKRKYDKDFIDVLTGARGSKVAFKDTIISKISSMDEEVETLDNLTNKVDTLFKQNPEKKPELVYHDISIIENLNSTILSEKIIGKQDLDISDMIRSLNLDDWVLQGKGFLESTNNKCPFCQQILPKLIEEQLEEYFDKTYFSKIDQLKSLQSSYDIELDKIVEYLHRLNMDYEQIIDFDGHSNILIITEQLKNQISNLFKQKISEPSLVLEYPNLTKYKKDLNRFLDNLKQSITDYDHMIDNLRSEKQKVTTEVWNYLLHEIKPEYDRYNKARTTTIRSRDGKQRSLDKIDEKIQNFKNEIGALRASAIGIDESVMKVNKQLKHFGFTNFKLETTPEKGVYKIIRPNGEMADETLSEGEKTFITFLYYYNLVYGNTSPDEEIFPKVLVIDDPISSLDSKVLFIVSTLIQDLILEVNKGEIPIKQIFVLTHNTYFYKEITNRIENECTYHILSKSEDVSKIISYEANPIKNSYQLLWDELKMSLENPVSITQNIMRRILENYFSFTGNFRLNSLIAAFEGEEVTICKSLIAWMHDGSHSIFEDLYVSSLVETKQLYFKVFKEIFIKTGHDAHFNMMVSNSFTTAEKMVFDYTSAEEGVMLVN